MKQLILCNLLLFTLITVARLQDNIFTFTPNNSICIGESVVITCYLYPPTANGYVSFARLSFNGSVPEDVTSINNEFASIGYVATVAIPTMGDSARIQLTITSFQVSDSNTVFGCHAQFYSDASVTPILESGTASLAADYDSPTCSGTVQLAWTPGASDRDIEMYFLSLNGVLIASLGPVTSYNHPTTLQREMEYTYSVVAMSCASNSTETPATSISVGSYSLSDGNPPFFLSYDQSTSNLFIDWSLVSPNTGLRNILIDYSLLLKYNHSQSDNISQFSDTSTFQQLSTDTDYTISLTPHLYTTVDGVVTDITVCLRITQQCGLAFSGVNMCTFFNSETFHPTPPTLSSSPTGTIISVVTTPFSTTSTIDILPIIIGVVAGVGAIILISVVILVFVTIVLISVCYNRNRKNTADKKSIHLYEEMNANRTYEYVDMNKMNRTAVTQTTESQHYTHMSPLDKKQLPPNYENMSKF